MSSFLTCFPYHRSPSACLEGTHGDRVAGDNTQHSHRLLSFSFYVTRSRTKRIQSRPLTYTLRQARRSLSRRRCGSCSVFEVAHSVYKNALNGCPFGCGCPTHNCNGVAISLAQGANITVATGNNITHTLRAYHLHCLAARVPSANKHIPLISTP